jgi:peptidyl-prolyl cis-trans isomerase D
MLQKIRDNSKGVLALGLMFLLFLSFAIWGIDFQFGQAASPVVVDGEPLPLSQVSRAYQRQLANYQRAYPNGIPDLQLEELKRGVLEATAQEEVIYRHAYKQGFRVSDQALADYLREQEAWQLGGAFSYDQFNLVAQQQGYSAEQFKEVIRRALLTEQLRMALMGSSFVTPAERAWRGELEQETRTASYFIIPSSRFSDEDAPDDTAIEAEYEANKDRYRTVESVKLQYLELNPEEMASAMEVDEDELRSIYDQGVEAGSYVREETRKSRHILIAASEGDEDALSAARTKAEGILERIRAGEDFATLATEFSDDPGSKKDGGALDWSPKAAFVVPFSEALFSMSIGDVSDVVQSQFGFHIIKLEDIRADEVRSYDDVRTELAREERMALATARVDELSRDLDELVYEYDQSLEPASEETGLPLRESTWITRSGGGGIGSDAQVREVAFSDAVFLDRRNSDAIRYRDGYIYLRIADHRPVRQRTLEEVRGEIAASLARKAAATAAREAGERAQEQLAGGTPMAEVAAQFEAPLTEAATLTRRGSAAPPELSRAVFASPAPVDGSATIGGSVVSGDSYAVFALETVTPGSPVDDASAQRYAQAQGSYEFRAYIDEVYKDADVTLRPDVLQ